MVLAGLATSIQTVGSLLRNPAWEKAGSKIQQKVSLVNSLQLKNALNNFSLNPFGKVPNLPNLSNKRS
jgi:hypothetical protein